MPFAYEIEPERRLVVITLSGRVTGTTVVEALQAVVADARWKAGFDRVWDGRGITSLEIEPEEVRAFRRLARSAPEAMRPGRAAVVAERTLYRDAAVLYVMAVGWETRVFPTMEQAMAWLTPA